MSQNSVFEDIKTGLSEAIAFSRGELPATITRITTRFSHVPRWTPQEIKNIRLSNHMTQRLFAQFMGVSVKTVEAWESGKNTPSGSASRLMQVITEHQSIIFSIERS